jgi:Flp pilus assembly protein TadG
VRGQHVDHGDVLMHAASRRSRGQGLVEFALVFPVFILLLMGLFDVGRLVFAYNTLSNASRDGARVAIYDQSISGGVYRAEQEAADQATMLGLDPATNEVQLSFRDLGGTACSPGLGCNAVMYVEYQWRAITPIVGTILGPITLNNTTELPVERTCSANC